MKSPRTYRSKCKEEQQDRMSEDLEMPCDMEYASDFVVISR